MSYDFKDWRKVVAEKDAEIERLKEQLEKTREIYAQAIRKYCIDILEEGEDHVEVTKFNAEIQKYLKEVENARSK